MAKSQFSIRIKLFVALLITVLALSVLGAMGVYFYVGHSVSAQGSSAEFTEKLVWGSSFTIDDVIKDQGYKYGWLKSKVDTQILCLTDGKVYEQTEGVLDYDEAARKFNVVGVGEGKIIFTNPVDSSISFTLPFETKFKVKDTETIIKAQFPMFYADKIVTADELENITQLTLDTAEKYDVGDFGRCKYFDRIIITSPIIAELKGLDAFDASVNFYVEPAIYSDYMESSAWRGYTERVFPAYSLDKNMANFVLTPNGGKWNGYDYTYIFTAAEKGKTFDMTDFTVARTGYTFTGWFKGVAGGAQLGEQFTATTVVTSDIKLYAGWKENSYNIVYVDEKFENTQNIPDVQHVKYTEVTHISDKLPDQTGMTFLYWLHENDRFDPGQEVVSLEGEDNANFVLRAVWQTNTYKIIYDANGGEGEPQPGDDILYDAEYKLSTVEPTRTGYDFVGWTTDKNSTVAMFHSGEVVSRLTDSDVIILYAVWRAKTYTITFNPMGGTAVTSLKVTYDKAYTLPTSARMDYYFRGWFTSSGSQFGSSGIWRSASNITLEAHWATKSATYSNSTKITVGSDKVSSNSCDKMDLKSLFGCSLSEYRSYGASTITFSITVYISEKDDGYQEVYLSTSPQTSSNALWKKTNIEHGSGKKDTSNWAHTFNVSVAIGNCNDTMYINYGSNGWGNNVWYRNSITVAMSIS